VSSLRRNHPEYSWLKACWLTVRTGGDNDSAGRSRRRSSQAASKKGSQKVLDRIERNHISRMNDLRKERKPAIGFALDEGDSEESAIKELVVVEDCDKVGADGEVMSLDSNDDAS